MLFFKNKKEYRLLKKVVFTCLEQIDGFDEYDSKLANIFIELSKLAEDLNYQKIKDVCLEAVIYMEGAETSEFAYLSKNEFIEKIKKIVKTP